MKDEKLLDGTKGEWKQAVPNSERPFAFATISTGYRLGRLLN